MRAEVPRVFVDSLGDLNLDPKDKPAERVWSAVVSTDAVVHVAGFLNQQRIPLASDFARHEIGIEDENILDLAVKISDLSEVHQSMPIGTMRATRSELLLLREIKRHVRHLLISERETELFEKSYRDIIRPFKHEFRKDTPRNTRIWLEALNPFSGLQK